VGQHFAGSHGDKVSRHEVRIYGDSHMMENLMKFPGGRRQLESGMADAFRSAALGSPGA
jgi:hypothetical protein